MKLSLFLILCLLQLSAWGTEIIIGCSYKCDGKIQTALEAEASKRDASIKIIDLSTQVKVNWEILDGVLIPGGADIDPDYYLPFVDIDLQEHTERLDHLIDYTEEGALRDPFEFGLLQEYFSDDKLQMMPLLGICRGLQMLAVSQKIPLYVDIKEELGINNRRAVYDEIHLTETGLMNQLFPDLTFFAYKYHHQGIRVPYYFQHQEKWPQLKITAFSNDNMIAESIEFTNRPALGVQFHPERKDDNVRKQIFSWFIDRSFKRKKEKLKVNELAY